MSAVLLPRLVASAAVGAAGLILAPCDRTPSPGGEPLATERAPLAFAAPSAANGEVAIRVRCDAQSRPVSPLIFGIGARPMHDARDAWPLRPTARRWGGNHTTRYNWELGNAWNTGHDWFFKNVDYDNARGPADRRFIDESAAHGAVTALTVPILGWVAKDTSSYGFPVSVFGAQAATESGNADVGNGVAPGGGLVAPGSPERTSTPMPPASVGRWVRAVRDKKLADGRPAVAMIMLDNEPTLWNETHRDVHPAAVSYDELLDKTVAYATEVRRADPAALIAGPAAWGYLALLKSGVDVAARPRTPDRDSHGAMPLMPWWLREVARVEQRDGVRLLDLVDVHFYPQGRGIGVGTEGETDRDTSARRIRSVRALWDPSYIDESWIAEPVRLVPRLEAWIREQHPGLGIVIGEYNFGAEQHMSGGLAVAEALGRFAQTGVRAAFYWDFPPAGSPASWAFRAYRDFDGAGGRFLDEHVPVELRAPFVSAFASRDGARDHLVLVLLDLDPSRSEKARIDLASCGAVRDVRRFVYTGGPAGLAREAVEHTQGAVVAALPAYSITVLDLHVSPPG